jgi:PleD family two-component response regulator
MSLPEEIDLWEVTRQYPIIISDDDIEIGVMMMKILAWQNLFSVANSRPEDTLYLCRYYPVSLVISDIMKPGMNGLELIQTLRGDTRTQHLPIIICSARCDKESVDLALELGANDFFSKPVLEKEKLFKLLTRIRQLLVAAYPGLMERQFDHTWQPDTTPTGFDPARTSYRVQIPDHEWVGQVHCL